MRKVYMDNIATTPCHPKVVEAMQPYFRDIFGNPQSDHEFGWKAKTDIEEARVKVANLINADAGEIIFTSSATEANNFVLKGISHAYEKKGRHIIISAIEHRSMLTPCKFLEKSGSKVTYLPVDKYGMVNPDDLRKAITDETILTSIMLANNEIGTIEPVVELSKIAKEKGILFHTDAACAVGTIPVDVNELNVDLMSLTAHKFYGPKGVGALYVRKGVKITPLIHGGVQERGRRTGIENVPGIVGFGVASELAKAEMKERNKHLISLRDRLVKGVLERIDHVYYNGHPTERLPNNANFVIEFVEGEAMLLSLMNEGIATASASTCTMMSLEVSHVLTSIGLPAHVANSSLVFSLGTNNTEEDVNRVLEVLPKVVERLRSMSAIYPGRQ
ncbi:MAG: aminotransferase class V-fold PLP-dependent enzyme [Nitrospirota bacterium]